jgi:hypothetical protein
LDRLTNLVEFFPIARLTAVFSEGNASSDDAVVPFCNRKYNLVLCVGYMSRPGAHCYGRISRDMQRSHYRGISLLVDGARFHTGAIAPVGSLWSP